jgi:hypothetical protein
MEASIHTIHCHTATGCQTVCRLMSALVNKPEVQYIDAVTFISKPTEFFLIIFL